MVINKQNIRRRFSKATKSYNQAAQAQQMIVNELISQLPESIKANTANRILEVGCGSGLLTQKLVKELSISHYIANDLSGSWREEVQQILRHTPHEFSEGDAETAVFSGTFHLITSSSAIQWFHAPHQFIANAYEALLPKGVLLFSTFSKDNFMEIKSITGRGLDYPSINELTSHLPLGTTIEWHEQRIELYFPSARMVLKHIQETGTGATNDQRWSRTEYTQFVADYEQFRTDKGYPLTYNPLYIKVIKTE